MPLGPHSGPTMAESGMRLVAPAKLNLWLTVLDRRPDGHHELDSLLVLLDLADALHVTPGEPGLVVRGAVTGVPVDESNLAWRGWVAGLAGAATEAGLELEKRIATAAGLGGGSSDAAAAWRLARALVGTPDEPPTADDLEELAAIGADVPFFAAQVGAARVGGIGEHVAEARGPAADEVVLVQPPFGLSTAAVFGELRPADWSGPFDEGELGRNDLLAPARRLRPELEDVMRLVAAAGGEPHLSGSGPTVFILTDDPERADGVAARMVRAGLATTRTLLRREPASIQR
jgi:4-diphosphocytidyl-2-C-methyl-D-erythritol kinase